LTTALERLEKQIEKVEKQIDDVEKQINGTQKQTDECEKQFDTCQDPIQRTAWEKKIDHLRKEKEHLRKEKEHLRNKEEQLRKKENLLLQQQQQASITAASTSQAFPVVIAVNALLGRLQRDLPRRPSSSADSSSCMTATAVEHSNPCSAIVEHDDSSSLANVDCTGCLWKPGRRSLTRHSASLPMRGIPVAEFGSYLKFVNREQQCEALVTHLQSSYLTFLQRIETPEMERGGPGDYLKAIQVIYSAGAPGVGKTTWARMALDHIPTTCVFDARFRPVLDRCTQRGWRYRICFGEDMVTTQELAMPNLSLAARLLWQHVKYELPRVSSVQSYDVFWRYLYDHHLTLATADVLQHICGSGRWR